MNNRLIPDSKWVPLDGLILEDNAITAIKEENNVLVIAGPGAGKTELLAQKACYLLQTDKCSSPRKILAISFKTDAAVNLKDRVDKRCGNIASKRFISMTYDAFSKRLLDRFRESLADQYRPDAEYLIGDDININKAFMEAGFVNTRGLSHSKLRAFFENQLASVVLPILEVGIKEKAWLTLVKGNVDVSPCLTFQMISRLAEYIIRTNAYLKKALLLTYSHVFLDEFQDTTLLQYELVKTCFINTSSVLTAVGDNKQRIMIWAGALEKAFENYCSDFKAIESPLLMNHRSAPRLVELQKMMYESLKDSPKKIICSSKWKENEGMIKLFKFSNFEQEAEVISNDILRLKLSGTKLKDICILAKQQPEKYTLNIIRKLEELGIRARIETIFQDLLKEPITLLILNSIELSLNKKRPDSWEQIMEFINIAFSDQINSSYDFFIDKQSQLYALLKDCKKSLLVCKDIVSFEKIIKLILSFLDVNKIKSMYPIYSQGDYYNVILQRLIILLWEEFQRSGYSWKNALDSFNGLNSIPIMTIHKSKGLEYDAIYFIGLEDSAFWNFRNQPMEDRCAFFVALSRAKKYISFTFSENRKVGFNDNQTHYNINEFFELLENSCIADILDYSK